MFETERPSSGLTQTGMTFPIPRYRNHEPSHSEIAHSHNTGETPYGSHGNTADHLRGLYGDQRYHGPKGTSIHGSINYWLTVIRKLLSRSRYHRNKGLAFTMGTIATFCAIQLRADAFGWVV